MLRLFHDMVKGIFTTLLLLLPLGTIPAFAQSKPLSGLPQHCSHIIVIEGEKDRHLVKGASYGDVQDPALMYPGPNTLAATKEALLRMTPFLCRSIRRIAFVRIPKYEDRPGYVDSYGHGDLVMINMAHSRFSEEEFETRRSSSLLFQNNLIHEAAHSAETLLGVESKDSAGKSGGSWTFEARTMARNIIEKTRLEKGFYKEWQRMHRSFVAQKWAQRYDNDGYERVFQQPIRDMLNKPRWKNASFEQIANSGFMNAYGATSWAEDIATFAGNVYIGPEMAAGIKGSDNPNEDLREDMACRAMQAHGTQNIPSKLAAVYTKLMFLLDVEILKEEDVAKCIGSKLGMNKVSGQGFYFFEEDKLLRSFENKVEAGMGSKGVGNVFEMRAEGNAAFGGKSYPASMKLSLGVGVGSIETASWPRGVYTLGLIGPNNLSLRLDGAQAGNFDAKDAYVLVASSSNKHISGSIFLTQAWRPNAPIPVPQVFDPPLNIRFQLKK